MKKWVWMFLVILSSPLIARGQMGFYWDTKPDSFQIWEGADGITDTLVLWFNGEACTASIDDDTASAIGGGSADSTFEVVTATDHFKADTISAPSDTSAGNFYFDKEDSNFYFYNGLVWMPMDTGATVTEDEIEDYIFNDDPGEGIDNYVMAKWFFQTNPVWNANAIPDSALQDTISKLGQIIETGEVKDDAINALKIDWGLGTNQMNLAIIPDSGFYVKMDTLERNKLTAIEENADVTDTTNVETVGALMDGDFPSNGLMKRSAPATYVIVTDNSGDWNTAYGWGDHSTQNYFDLDWVGNSDSITEGSVNLFEDLTDNPINDLSNVNASPSDGQIFYWNNGASQWQAKGDDDTADTDGKVTDALTVGPGGTVALGATVSISDNEVKGGTAQNYLYSDGTKGVWKMIAEGELPEAMTRDDELLSCDSITENLIPDHADSNRDLGSSDKPWGSVYADAFFGIIPTGDVITSGQDSAASEDAVYDFVVAGYQPLEATLTDIADGTIAENLVNTANPWAENEIVSSMATESEAKSYAGDSASAYADTVREEIRDTSLVALKPVLHDSLVAAQSIWQDDINDSLAGRKIYPDSIGSYAQTFAKGYFNVIVGTTSHSVVEGCTIKATEGVVFPDASLDTLMIKDAEFQTYIQHWQTGGDTIGWNIATILGAFTGNTNIVTLGTIGTGTWQGTDVGSTYIDPLIARDSEIRDTVEATVGTSWRIPLFVEYTGAVLDSTAETGNVDCNSHRYISANTNYQYYHFLTSELTQQTYIMGLKFAVPYYADDLDSIYVMFRTYENSATNQKLKIRWWESGAGSKDSVYGQYSSTWDTISISSGLTTLATNDILEIEIIPTVKGSGSEIRYWVEVADIWFYGSK